MHMNRREFLQMLAIASASGMALDSQAWLQIRTGQDDKARETLRMLLADVAAPDGVKGRANGLLSRLGETAPPAPAPGAGG